jgi:hypothetical protein
MAPRPTPPPSDIVRALETMRGHDTGPLMWDNAVEVIRRSLRTTKARAEGWLRDAALIDRPGVYWMKVSHRGMLHGIVRDTGHLVIRSMKEAGFDVDSVQLDVDGSVWEGGSIRPPEKGWAENKGSDGVYVAVLKSTLDTLVAKQVEVNNARSVNFAAEKITEMAALEVEHGEALGYILGLYDAVGIDLSGLRHSRIETSPSRPGRKPGLKVPGRVEVTLYGDDIDRLGEALKSLGVQPKQRDK